jgi:DMSO reductase family type II enzyme molybdopterin subunit
LAMLNLELAGLTTAEGSSNRELGYDLKALRRQPWSWDRIVKSSHLSNCWYSRACNFNVYIKDGIALREEQAANYPPSVDPAVPDPNPRGCQKGVCYTQRMYDPTRVKYPLKRVGERGEGRWQRVSWDQALTEISDMLLDVLMTEGPETVIQGGGTRVHSQASEGMALNAFFEALGSPLPSQNVEIGDDHQGAAVTLGKIMFADSPDNWFYADTILAWGANPAYTNCANFHYIAEARYSGSRVIAISPDYNASAIHADEWIPVNVGSDAALALSLAQVIIREGLYRHDFVREQTDLPLLVRLDDGKLLRQKDLKIGGRDDAFYIYDLGAKRIQEAPRKHLGLGNIIPALEGEYEVHGLSGPIKVRPVFALLKDRLDERFSPEQAAAVCGVAPSVIRSLAHEVAAAKGVVNITTGNWGKFYHGDLIERAIILVFALCGHMGRKGATFSAFPALTPDTALGALERTGHQMLTSAAGVDPRYVSWKEDGYTTEMILYEYVKQATAAGAFGLTGMVHYVHGGLTELAQAHEGCDPYLKRPIGDYVDEALAKGWQVVSPPAEKEPRILFQVGGNVFRRGRATNQLLSRLLPKLKLIVTVDWRMSATGLYSDYILPACGWYERTSNFMLGCTQSRFMQVVDKATEPLYESRSEWSIFVHLAKNLVARAGKRGVSGYIDRHGKERRLDKLEEQVTCGGVYAEDDEEGLARDSFVNSTNREEITWEEFKERGIAAYTGLGTAVRSIGNACDMKAGEPFVPLTWHTEKKEPYPTLTRRIQFYIDHQWYLELDEHLPTHKDCPKAGGNYPLQITGGHARWSMHSDWVDDAIILGLQRGEPVAFFSPKDADSRQIRDGDFVELYNDVADCRILVAVSAAVRPGQVIIYHAWENYQFDGWRHFKSIMPAPPNPIEFVGGYGHLRPDTVTLSPGPSDRGTRVEARRV